MALSNMNHRWEALWDEATANQTNSGNTNKRKRKKRLTKEQIIQKKLKENWYKQAGYNGEFNEYGKPKKNRIRTGYNTCKK